MRLAVNGLYQKMYVLEINRDFNYLLTLNVYSMNNYNSYVYLYIKSTRKEFVVDSLVNCDNFVTHCKRLLISISFITHVSHIRR